MDSLKCPACWAEVNFLDTSCHKCRIFFSWQGECPSCGAAVNVQDNNCGKCKAYLYHRTNAAGITLLAAFREAVSPDRVRFGLGPPLPYFCGFCQMPVPWTSHPVKCGRCGYPITTASGELINGVVCPACRAVVPFGEHPWKCGKCGYQLTTASGEWLIQEFTPPPEQPVSPANPAAPPALQSAERAKESLWNTRTASAIVVVGVVFLIVLLVAFPDVMSLLRDPFWAGVSAIVAIIALAAYIYVEAKRAKP